MIKSYQVIFKITKKSEKFHGVGAEVKKIASFNIF